MISSRYHVMTEGVLLVGAPKVPRLGLDEADQVGTADSVRPDLSSNLSDFNPTQIQSSRKDELQ
jgi:hypothetical protein